MTDRTINHAARRPIVRSIVGRNDRTINRGNRGNRGTKRPTLRSIVASCDRSYDQSCDYRSAIIHNWWRHHARLVVRSRKTYLRPLTIWNRRSEVFNMTIDLVTTDFTLAITHDLWDLSYILSTTCPRFQHFSVAGRS